MACLSATWELGVAVLLGGGSNITLVDEDDDEPLRLG